MTERRYIALDSWRGLAAVAVVVFHFRNTVGLNNIETVNGLYLFVDFFFVLSGFVISSAYFGKIIRRQDALRFLWVRLGRVYPLHIAVLLAFVFLQIVIVYPRTEAWFPAPNESWDTILAQFFLVHSLNLFVSPTWNQPSWSISVEFAAYVAFAAAAICLGRRIWIAALAVVIVAPTFLYQFNEAGDIDATATWGFVRCFFGFSAGMLTYEAYRRYPKITTTLSKYRFAASTLEFGLILMCVVFIASAVSKPLSLAAPIVFAVVVLSFAAEAGVVSVFLKCRPLVALGTISYSVYMVHMLILSWWLEFTMAFLQVRRW